MIDKPRRAVAIRLAITAALHHAPEARQVAFKHHKFEEGVYVVGRRTVIVEGGYVCVRKTLETV